MTGKWDKKVGEVWHVSVRCGGRGVEHVGKECRVQAKDGRFAFVTLGRLVQDYGPGDVCLFEAVKQQ